MSIKLSGAPNFRDLGGYRTSTGKKTRRGLLFRSDGFQQLTPEDISRISSLSFKLRCDLRSESERMEDISLWPDNTDPMSVLTIDMGADPRSANKLFFDKLTEDFTPSGAFNAMCTFQKEMPRLIGSKLIGLFNSIIEHRRLPAVIHCHHGKDRTGFVSALILNALDVMPEDIIHDYMLTNALIDKNAASISVKNTIIQYTNLEPGEEIVDKIVSAQPEYLHSAINKIISDYGSVRSFLSEEAQLDSSKLEKLQRIMLK